MFEIGICVGDVGELESNVWIEGMYKKGKRRGFFETRVYLGRRMFEEGSGVKKGES